MDRVIPRIDSSNNLRISGENDLAVPPSRAVPGITFNALPASKMVIETTAGSNAAMRRDTIDCKDCTMAAPQGIGSIVGSGSLRAHLTL